MWRAGGRAPRLDAEDTRDGASGPLGGSPRGTEAAARSTKASRVSSDAAWRMPVRRAPTCNQRVARVLDSKAPDDQAQVQASETTGCTALCRALRPRGPRVRVRQRSASTPVPAHPQEQGQARQISTSMALKSLLMRSGCPMTRFLPARLARYMAGPARLIGAWPRSHPQPAGPPRH